MLINFFWFRRDLRLYDNAGLYYALKEGKPVQPVFIFDTDILDKLEDKHDRRLVFIHRQLEKLNKELLKYGSSLLVKHGKPIEVWNKMINEYQASAVFTNHDYEPYAIQRDENIRQFLSGKKIEFHTFKDQVIFEKNEITKDDGLPYTVFTPYMNKWRKKFEIGFSKPFPCEKYFKNFHPIKNEQVISLNSMGFEDMNVEFPSGLMNKPVIANYDKTRDFPAETGTSRLSIHLRFGTVSIRELIRNAWELNYIWINELIWREFYMMILWHFPHVTGKSFKPAYEFLPWRNNESEFNSWCIGMTGYPIVDAGMRELNETGFMHNRLRMITAMFLTKYLLIDWKWGEAYFAKKLSDYELSSNNSGWQWSAGTGVDAAPYFRIFSMIEQTKRFDPSFEYIEKWVPEFRELTYPAPIVDYVLARKRCLDFYKKSLIQ